MLHGSSSCVPPEESLPGSGRLLELLYLRAATSRCSPPSMATDDNGPAGCDWRDDERSRCRSPIEVWEMSHLESLGPRIRALRQDAGLSQATLGAATELSRTSIERVELGLRRTRRSTLERIVAVLVAEPARQGAPRTGSSSRRRTRSCCGSPGDCATAWRVTGADRLEPSVPALRLAQLIARNVDRALELDARVARAGRCVASALRVRGDRGC